MPFCVAKKEGPDMTVYKVYSVFRVGPSLTTFFLMWDAANFWWKWVNADEYCPVKEA